ncbi:hypothetical protein ACFLSQ_05615 [Bacteroidota bacterium]
MSKSIKTLLTCFLLLSFLILSIEANAGIKEQKGKKEQVQRTPTQNFDLQWNTVSSFQFPVTNYGILFLDVAMNRGGGYWPRGSLNQYLFGGGIWFAAQKWIPTDSLKHFDALGNELIPPDTVRYRKLTKLCEITYNPNSGSSWMVPGRIEDGDEIDNTDIYKYRNYFSTDFRTSDGVPLNPDDGANWPIWDASTDEEDVIKEDRYFGYYISETEDRIKQIHPRGPAFISGEDIFATFKDTDLNYYEGGKQFRENLGYPMRLQFEQYIYSWGFGDYKDFIFIRYEIINKSPDTLWNCWLAPIMDVDVARSPNVTAGAGNDFARFYDEDDSLNLALQWTRDDPMEKGYGFGYLGFDFLESPAVFHCERSFDTLIVDSLQEWCEMCIEKDTVDGEYICVDEIKFPKEYVNFPRKDRKWYKNEYQLGLRTFKRWPIAEDILEDEARYNNLSANDIEFGEGEAGDYRFLMATGPFNLMPGDTMRTVVGMILANAAAYDDADGSTEDLVELVRKDIFAQKVYDNNFQAPIPPEKSLIYRWDPLNNAVALQWDSTSEMTYDKYERGLDFMGFKLYRARRVELDTFNVDEISPSVEYTSGKGPFGWKQVAQWELPTPFRKSYNRGGPNPEDISMPFIDSLEIVGPNYERNIAGEMVIDTFGIKVMRIAKGLVPFGPYSFARKNMKQLASYINPQRAWNRDTTLNVFIHSIDTTLISKPWGNYFLDQTKPSDFPLWYDPYNPDDPKNRHFLLDSVLIGTIKLNRALLDFNPLYWRRVTVNVSTADTAEFPDIMDTITNIKYLKDTYRTMFIDGSPQLVMDQLQPIADINKAMCDTVLVRKALDSIYSYIQNGKTKFEFPDFVGREEVRADIIAPYMKEITRGNRFTDIGDDNMSGDINFNLNPAKTEKLINNVPYYYKLLAYDEGDFMQPTPQKLNSGFEGLPNLKECYPRASRVMNNPQFKITYLDSTKIGGLYNFKFFGYDPDRVRQLFSGHTLEMEFEPLWFLSNMTITKKEGETQIQKTVPYAMYSSLIKIKDLTDDNRLLFQQSTYLEQTSGQAWIRGGFTENAQSWVVDYEAIEDTIRDIMIIMPDLAADTIVTRTSIITTGDFKQPGYFYTRGFLPPAYGTIGFSFNYTAQQRGGVYRPDSASIYPPVNDYPSPILKGDATVPINFITDIPGDLTSTFDSSIVYRTQAVGTDVYGYKLNTTDEGGQLSWVLSPEFGRTTYGSYNNGPAEYIVEFKPGGSETLSLKSDKLGATKDFVCDYLLMDVKNVISYKRPNPKGDSIVVSFPLPIEHMEIDTGYGNKYPHLGYLGIENNDFIGRYNLSTYGWINGYKISKTFDFNPMYAVPGSLNSNDYKSGQRISLGKQGRYYQNGRSVDGQDSVFFVNVFLASGVSFVFDLAKNERVSGVSRQWKLTNEIKDMALVHFKPGDQVMLKTNGGALGFPMPGAKLRVYIDSNIVEEGMYTDNLLEQVRVVPNPYYITHQAQASPYDAKIYFTKLPKRASINIYTITGDLVRTLEHNEFTSPERDKTYAEIWDLLTKNRQRVQSQTFVAVISTPDGAQTVKKFSVVVGGFRLVPEDE